MEPRVLQPAVLLKEIMEYLRQLLVLVQTLLEAVEAVEAIGLPSILEVVADLEVEVLVQTPPLVRQWVEQEHQAKVMLGVLVRNMPL